MNSCRLIKHYGPLIARILIAQLFVIAGFGKFAAFPRTAAFLANAGLPMPELLLVLTIALELGGGILLILGWKARWVAAGLFGFTLIATIMFHPFWAVEPELIKNDMNNFMKNLAIMGAMLYIMAYGPGPLSLGKDDCAEDQTAPKLAGSLSRPEGVSRKSRRRGRR
jgi:putative oxidoreductase